MCPIPIAELDAILNNPVLTTDEQSKLTAIEATIDSLLPVKYSGTTADIDKIQYFHVPLYGVHYKRRVKIWEKLQADYKAVGWDVNAYPTVALSVMRFTALP